MSLDLSYLSERDRQALDRLGYGARQGWGSRPALLVVDTNYEFCGHEGGPLLQVIQDAPTACGEEAWRAVPFMRRLIDACRAKGVPVFYSTNTRRPDRFDAGSWNWKGAQRGPRRPRMARADDIVDAIAPHPQDFVIAKTKPSVFFGTPFLAMLLDLKVDSLIVCGGTTSGCVRATAVDAFSHNLRCAVVAEACFDRLQASHAMSLVDLHAKYADVVGCDEALGFIGSLEPGLFILPPSRESP